MITYVLALIRMLRGSLRVLAELLAILINLLRGEITGTPEGDDCCIDLPDDMRPRPDPYVYSQDWLDARGFAYSWDNPDFVLIDSAGVIADRMQLRPNEQYRVVIHVHNGSLMPAVGTDVSLETREFGIGGLTVSPVGSVTIDIGALGTEDATFRWTSPGPGVHSCLRVTLQHPDDGNPQNNVGQHNTEVIHAESNDRSTFIVRNPGREATVLRLVLDSYLLPETPMRARSLEERNSREYLRALQARNSRAQFPVPEVLNVRLLRGGAPIPQDDQHDGASGFLEVDASGAVTLELAANAPAPGQQAGIVNVSAFDGAVLVGGLTIYLDAVGV